MAITLFIGSSFNLNAITFKSYDDSDDCAELAYNLQGDLEEQGVPQYFANAVANYAYDVCESAQNGDYN